jgi:hypothetical protein
MTPELLTAYAELVSAVAWPAIGREMGTYHECSPDR